MQVLLMHRTLIIHSASKIVIVQDQFDLEN